MPPDTEPFLETDPPHWAARSLTWLVLGVFVAALVAAIVITLPERVSSPFVLVPGHGTDPIRASRGGVVAAVRVAEGQTVARGAPAFVIRSSLAGDRSAELRTLETQMSGAEESRLNVRQRYESQRRADGEEERRLSVRTAHLRDKLAEQRGLREVREMRFQRDLEIQGNEIEITRREIELKRGQYAVARELTPQAEPAPGRAPDVGDRVEAERGLHGSGGARGASGAGGARSERRGADGRAARDGSATHRRCREGAHPGHRASQRARHDPGRRVDGPGALCRDRPPPDRKRARRGRP